MAGAFLCHKTSARSRDGAESRPPLFLTIEYARINPKAHGGWHLRVRTAPRFSKPPYSRPSRIHNFGLSALRLLAFSGPCGPRGACRSDTKPGSGAKNRARREKTQFLRLAAENTKLHAPQCAARPRRTCQANEIVFHIRRLLKLSKNLLSLQQSRSGRKRRKRASEEPEAPGARGAQDAPFRSFQA